MSVMGNEWEENEQRGSGCGLICLESSLDMSNGVKVTLGFLSVISTEY